MKEIYLLRPHLFVKVPRLGDSEGTFLVIESICHLYQPLSALPMKMQQANLPAWSPHSPFMNAMQGSCRTYFFKTFALTLWGNWNQVYRLWGGCSNISQCSGIIDQQLWYLCTLLKKRCHFVSPNTLYHKCNVYCNLFRCQYPMINLYPPQS